jgi:nascent polypeptide-associated complex subunit alpha
MMPNIDPRTLKSMMAKMGIKSEEIDAEKVTITCKDVEIVISNPSVTRIEAQGVTSFQIGGEIEEREISQPAPSGQAASGDAKVEITDDDIRMVSENTGVSDLERVRKALEDTNGDIAKAIMNLKSDQ